MPGLAATYYDNATLSPSAPTQTVHVTGVGDPTGALDANWGTTPPPGVTTTGWSARFTGYVTAPTTNTYTFSVTGTGSAAIYVSNTLTSSMSLTAGVPVPIRVDYTAPTSGGASLGLDWSSGGPTTLVPGSDLDPGYGLATTQTDADGKKTGTSYSGPGVDPAEGLPTASIVDPGGLNLTTTTIYEPTGTGYFRKTNTILPSGAASSVTDTYYAPTAPAPATNCNTAGAIQGGLLQTETGAGASPLVHNYVYDGAGRVVATEVPGDANWSCTSFDGRGRIASSSDPSGHTTSYNYSNPVLTVVSYTDSAGNAKTTSIQVDFDGRQVAYTDELGNTSTQSYDQASRVTATARGSTTLTAISYDAASRVSTTVDDVGGGTFSFGYNKDGNLTQISRPNGVTTFQGYDPSTGWLTSITSTSSSGPLPAAANSSYVYSAAKRITSQTSEGQTSSFSYDAAGRLSAQDVNGVTTTYAYDLDSNRCAINASSCNGSFSYDAADEITASPGVSSYSYTSNRRDVSAIGTQTISYDGNDHMTQTVDASGTTTDDEVAPSGRVLQTASYLLGGLLNTADTFFGYSSPSSDSPSYTEPAILNLLGLNLGADGSMPTDYVNGPGGLLAEDSVGLLGIVTPTYPIADAHGDIVGTTGSSGAFTANPATDAWGVGSSAPANNLGYLGNDERYTTGAGLDLIQMGVRLYDPALGRFLEPDPVGGGSANAYDYCAQDPVNCLDLAGTFSFRHLFRLVDRYSSIAVAVLSAIAPICPACALAATLAESISVAAEGVLVIDDCVNHKNHSCLGDIEQLGFSLLTVGAGKALGSIEEELGLSEEAAKNLEREVSTVGYAAKLAVQGASGRSTLP